MAVARHGGGQASGVQRADSGALPEVVVPVAGGAFAGEDGCDGSAAEAGILGYDVCGVITARIATKADWCRLGHGQDPPCRAGIGGC